MNVDLQVFDYKIIGYRDEPPRLVDWEFLGLQNNEAVFDNQYFKYGIEIEKVQNGHNIKIDATVGIPSHLLTPGTPKGAFNLYKGNSTFFVPLEEIRPVTAAEIAINHFGKMSSAILSHTFQITNRQRPYYLQLPSLSKIILQAEALLNA